MVDTFKMLPYTRIMEDTCIRFGFMQDKMKVFRNATGPVHNKYIFNVKAMHKQEDYRHIHNGGCVRKQDYRLEHKGEHRATALYTNLKLCTHRNTALYATLELCTQKTTVLYTEL